MFTKGFRHDVELNLIQRDFIDAAGTVREASVKMGALLALWVMPVVFQPETRLGRFLGCSFHTPPRTLFFWLMPENEEQPLAPRRPGKKRVFRTPDGQALIASDFKLVSKFDRDLIVYCHGEQQVVVPSSGKKKERTEWVTQYDPDLPEPAGAISPGVESPVCKQCGLFEHDARHPFMAYSGPDRPLITVIFDGVTRAEDIVGELGTEGSPAVIRRIIKEASEETGVSVEDIRWVPMTRCTNWLKKVVNLKTHGNWCRHHVIDDLRRHPPVLVMPVGTAALGLLSHKSNAQEWSGRLLTYRGWPDDWLTNPKYALPRPDPRVEGRTVTGHPLFGPVPKTRIPMVPVQAPRLIFFAQNPVVYTRWSKSIVNAVRMAKEGVKALNYTRDYYHWTANVDSVEFALNEILQHPGLLVSYDTETTGLRPWAPDAAIVSMMFRWEDPATGKPRTVGFPWDYGPTPQYPDYELSPMRPHLERLKPLIWKVLTQSTLIGHNLTFDMLYTFATWWREHLVGWDDPALNAWRDRRLVALANASKFDTWHMAFAWQQKRGSLGLDALAYDWVPELAGYEEDMTLLINLHYDRMHPGANKGGHYLNCPVSQHKDYVVPYVMGDVEVCYRARAKILSKLETSDIYEFPLAHPDRPGKFRFFAPPSRHWVYHKIMSPASRVLMKMMARGLYIDEQALIEMETNMPKKIKQLREELSGVDPRIQAWCEQQAATETAPDGGKWVLDLENKGQLKDLLFKTLDLPVARLTKQGRKQLGEDIVAIKAKMSKAIADEKPDLADKPVELAKAVELQLREVAAVDKFTLNKLLVDHEFLRPLQDYRKLFKLYSTYVRPLRNLFSEGLDKKQRVADPHLCFDQCIHASFLMTGTRGGRLSCKNPNLQQLPRDGEVKQMFVSRFGERGCLYQGDLSQIELRLLAAACGDPTMVRAYFNEEDLHALTTSRIFNVPYEHFAKAHMEDLQSKGHVKEAKELDEKRSIGKTVNFLTGYGGGAFGLQNVLAMKGIYKKIEECEHIIEMFFDAYPALRDLLQRYKRFILDAHVAVSIFGRVRVFEEVRGDDEEAKAKALRAGCNHLIQATASDMMLIALFVIEDMMRVAGLESMVVSTVHDSLVIDCVRQELSEVHDIVMLVLNNFPDVFKVVFGQRYDTSWMIVPFTGDCDVGHEYFSMRKIPKKDIDWDKLLST